jgi:hypothetical protein
MLVCVLSAQSWQFVKLREGQTITTARIRAHLLEASERALNAGLAEADKESRFDERQHLRELAKRDHEARLRRIDDLAASFVELEQRVDASPVLREMTRILHDEKINPVDKAIAYAEGERQALLARVRARNLAEQERNRRDLLPLLQAASLERARGRPAAARSLFGEVLEFEPAWPMALEKFASFLNDQSLQSQLHGTFRAAVADAEQSFELADRLYSQDKAKPDSQRVLSTASNRLGDVLAERAQPGDVEQALRHYTRSQTLDETLLERNRESAEAASDLAVSLQHLGDLLAQQDLTGNAEKVLLHYTRSLELYEALRKRDPESAEAARHVAIGHGKLGDFFAQRDRAGDADLAQRHYTCSVKISEALLKRDPESAQAARDVSVSVVRLGYVLAHRGTQEDAEQALRYYKRSVELAEAALNRTSESAEAARDVSVSLLHLGRFFVQRGAPGDAEQALGHYKRSVDLAEELLRRNPESAQAARDVSISLAALADLLAQRREPGDTEQAARHYTRSLELKEALLKQNPASARAESAVLDAQYKLGVLELGMHRFESAAAHFKAGITVLDGMIAKRPNDEQVARNKAIYEQCVELCHDAWLATGDWQALLSSNSKVLPRLLYLRAWELAKQGRTADVAQAGAKLRELLPKTSDNLYNAGCAYALCAALVVKDKSASTKAGQAEREKFIELSLACLKEALATGYVDLDQMKQHPDLAALRNLPEFQNLFHKTARK